MITRGSDDSKPAPRRGLALGVLISGSGSTLANLIERIADGRLRGVAIRLVISSRASVAGVDVARRAGLPVEIVRRKDHDEATLSERISGLLDAAGVDLVVMGGFLCHWRLPARYVGRTLNIHPALLPDFGGKGMYGEHVHRAVLGSGAAESGCTVHLVDEQYDHGPIIAQRRVPVQPGDTPESLARRVAAEERELYPWVIQQVADHGLAWLRRFEPASP
ncbi:MAG: phosphoribosylglycinamide formyltransferase, partial [Phycisphaerae bacterium]|nr:phosphoribosylglycinamide formyltransferase [Phycisphaerae bacterium]